MTVPGFQAIKSMSSYQSVKTFIQDIRDTLASKTNESNVNLSDVTSNLALTNLEITPDITSSTFITEWIVASTINGQRKNDQYGHSVSMSSNGKIVAMGAPNHDTYKGYVRVHQII